jgi:hypothetical protein
MSDMPRWVAILFWVWFFVSLVILVMRRVNKRGATDETVAAGTGTASADSSAVAAGVAATPPAEKVWPAPPPPDPDDDTFRLDPTEVGDPDTSGDSSPTEAGESPGPTPPAGARRAALPELLAGITLPHELVPLTQSDVAIDLASHIGVHTRKASAEVVTSAMCAELEKLGYDVERESMLKVRASGDRGTVLVEVHPDGARVLDGTARRFPTATEGSVVVELWAV